MVISVPASRPVGSAPEIINLSESVSVVVSTTQLSFSSTFSTLEQMVLSGFTK